MKKSIRLLAALLMLSSLAFGLVSAAGAEAPIPEIPSAVTNNVYLPVIADGAVVHVQNMGTIEARYAIAYEYGDGAAVESGWINPGSSWTFIPDATRVAPSPITGIPTGAAIVFQIASNSDDDDRADNPRVSVPFGVSVDRAGITGGESATPEGGNGAYTGFGRLMLPALTEDGYWLYAPVIHKNFHGWNSIIRVQNAQWWPAQFDIWFYDVNGNPVNTITNFQLAAALLPGSSAAINPAAAPADLPDGTYSAWIRVTGLDTDLQTGAAVVVDEFKDGLALTYRGSPWQNAAPEPITISQGGGNLITGEVATFAPLIFKAFNQWNAAIRVTNVDPNQHGLIKVTFRDMDGTAIATFTDDIDRRSFKDYFFQDMNFLPQNFVGSATVESQPYSTADGNFAVVPIIAVVQQTKWITDASYPKNGMAYNTINWNQGSDILGAPFLSKYATSGFSSGMQVMNLDRTPGWTDVTVDIYTAAGRIWDVDINLEAFDSKTFDLRNIADDVIPRGFVGSGEVSGTTSTQSTPYGYLGGIVNEVSFFNGITDGGKAYEMFPERLIPIRIGRR